MPFSVEMELDNGGTVIFDNVVSFIVEENPEPSPDEVPEEGEVEREGGGEIDGEEPDLSVDKNPMAAEDEEENNLTK